MKNLNSMTLKHHAESIFKAGLSRVHSKELMVQVLSLDGDKLKIKTEQLEATLDLSMYKNIYVLGFGKAAAQMSSGLCQVLGSKVKAGVVVVKDKTDVVLPSTIEVVAGTHPVLSESSLKAGEKVLSFCRNLSEDDLVFGLVSGGASALMEVPVSEITLSDLIKVNEALLGCGATINEMNAVRKHLSQIKGGRLAKAIEPAVMMNFILSDVVGDHLDVIASGPTVLDPSTFSDALKVITKYKITNEIPANVVEYLKNAKDETPKEIYNVRNVIVGSNRQALAAAKNKARALGYETIIVSDQIQGEARNVASNLYDLSHSGEIGKMKKPLCLLAGGETTVTLRGEGRGGRNQEMALAFLNRFMKDNRKSENRVFLSASTDGGDGPTDSAGAFVTEEILKTSRSLNLSPQEFLSQNNSYVFFEKVGGHLKTGATETNVCDLQIILIEA